MQPILTQYSSEWLLSPQNYSIWSTWLNMALYGSYGFIQPIMAQYGSKWLIWPQNYSIWTTWLNMALSGSYGPKWTAKYKSTLYYSRLQNWWSGMSCPWLQAGRPDLAIRAICSHWSHNRLLKPLRAIMGCITHMKSHVDLRWPY